MLLRARTQGQLWRAALQGEGAAPASIVCVFPCVCARVRSQEQLARCRIDKVARGTPSPALRLSSRATPGASPDGAQALSAGKRR